VTLTKGDNGLGFTVIGGTQTDGRFYVRDVLYDPALSEGSIHKGDRLLKVNGHAVTGLSHKAAIELLRQTPHNVTLVLQRPLPVSYCCQINK
jgi:tyrosine-protein phosphatase non-receptor type 13 protein